MDEFIDLVALVLYTSWSTVQLVERHLFSSFLRLACSRRISSKNQREYWAESKGFSLQGSMTIKISPMTVFHALTKSAGSVSALAICASVDVDASSGNLAVSMSLTRVEEIHE